MAMTASGLAPGPPDARPDVEQLGRASSPIFVGRGDELARLLDVTARSPSLVLIEGEPGVGKTRLVQELLRRRELAGRRAFLGRCHELSEPFPLGPLVDALRGARLSGRQPAVTGALRPLLPELADRLPEAPAPLGDAGAERHRLFRGLLELLTSFGPSLLLVEDLHWADQATLEFLRILVLQPPPELTVVGTYRREDVADGSPLLRLDAQLPAQSVTARIALPPLNQEEVRELVATILDTAAVSTAFAECLHGQTAGLPLAVEEVLLLLRQRRDLVCQQGVWVRQQLDALAVPPRLRDAINERLSRLGPSARALVQAAAVLSLPADEQLLSRVTGLPEPACADALAESLASALLFEVGDGRYGFRHALAQQAVEEGVPTPVRRRLHLRAARALEARRELPLARLARHYRAAGETAKWVRYAEAAADRAISLNDHAAAYALLREAVSIRDIAPVTRGWLAIKLARHALRCRAYEDSIAILPPLLDDEAIPVRLRGRLRFLLGRLLYDTGDPQAAHSQVVRALGELDGPMSAQAMAWLAVTPSGADSIERRLRWFDAAMRLAAQSSDQAMTMEIAASRAVLLVRAGDPACWPAIENIPSPGSGPAEIEQAIRGYGNVADALLHLGRYQVAEDFNGRALRLAREHSPSYSTNFEMTAMQLDWLTGRWSGLEQRLRSAVRAVEDWPTALHICEAFLGLLLLAQGRTQPALAILSPLSAKLEGDIRVLTWIAAALGQARLAEGDPGAAVEAIEPALRAVDENQIWLCAGDLVAVGVEASLAAGRPDEARRLIARLAEEVRGKDAPAAAAAVTTCRALVAESEAQPEQAAALFGEAERSWLALPRPYLAANARARAGRCLLTVDVAQARALLQDALAAFETLGAGWDAALVRQTLRRHGLIPAHRRGRRSYGNELSPREAEVARLASEGLNNREIARTLHLSVKTVEGHLSSASRKLGVSSRAELPDQLR